MLCAEAKQLFDPIGRRITVPEASSILLEGSFEDFEGVPIDQQAISEFFLTIQDSTGAIIRAREDVSAEVEADGTFSIPVGGADTTPLVPGEAARHYVTYEFAWVHPTDGQKRSFEFYYFDVVPALVVV